jgi:hypothetical protein
MLEFALSMPVLALLLMGSLAMGRFAYDVQIVRESAQEGAKLGAVDRLAPPGQDQVAYTPANEQILQWVRVAAHTGDPSIDPHAIAIAGDPSGGDGAWWEFNPNEQPPDMDRENTFGGISQFIQGLASLPSFPYFHLGQCSASSSSLEQMLNPGLTTMRLVYNHDSGFGSGYRWSVRIDYSFSRYEMFTFPLSGYEGGCIHDPGP